MVLGALFLARNSTATVMVPLSIAELTSEADLIVHGHIVAKSTSRDTVGSIVTRVGVFPVEVWKGVLSGPDVHVLLAGGILGESEVSVEGQADYTPGEEVVLFLKLNPDGQAVTVGLGQGKFEVLKASDASGKRARNLFHGRTRASAQAPDTGCLLSDPLALADLKRRVLSMRK